MHDDLLGDVSKPRHSSEFLQNEGWGGEISACYIRLSSTDSAEYFYPGGSCLWALKPSVRA